MYKAIPNSASARFALLQAFHHHMLDVKHNLWPQTTEYRCTTLVCGFCVWWGLFFSAALLSIPGWKQLFSVIQSGLLRCFAWGPLLYQMQILESLVSGDNPVFKAASQGRNGGKHGPCLFSTPCANRGKKIILLPSAASLKRVNRSNSRGCKHLWGRLLPNLETLCNLYNLVSWALSSPWTSPPGHLSYLWAPTGSSSAKVSPPQCKSLPPQTLCRAQHCGWWSSGSHREVWCPAGPLHWRWWPSGDRRTRRHRLINQCSCVHKPTLPSAESGCRNENYPAGLKEEFIDFSGHVKIHKVRHFICLPCLNCS